MSTITHSDDDLVRRVVDAMNWDTDVDAERIHVELSDGVATLTGEADSYAGKLAAQSAAHRVQGVRDVANDIEVRPVGLRSDTEIAHAVRHALQWQSGVPHELIEVTVEYGFVTLQGSVYRLTQRDRAEDAINGLIGVRGVKNLIQIKPEAAMSETAQGAIHEALERQAGREADRISISVAAGGVVTVTGTVRTWDERSAVLGAVRHTPFVAAIQDHLIISASA